MNLKDDYVSVRIAELLKENGFDEWCGTFYINGRFNYGTPIKNSYLTNGVISAPTMSLAMKWLREKYKVFISILRDKQSYVVDFCDENGYSYCDSEEQIRYTSYYDAIERTLFNILADLHIWVKQGYTEETQAPAYENLEEYECYAKHIEERYENNPMAFLAAMDMAAYIKDKVGAETAPDTTPTPE